MELNWADTRDILRQLESVFQSEDSDMVVTMAQRASEIQAILDENKVGVQNSIRGP